MSPRARTAGAIVAALVMLGIGAASRAPWTASPADLALLRLSWRVQSETAEECRPLTEEEKADLPVHMQVPELCEARAIPYLLQVTIDGSEAVSDTVHGAGARADRPITIFREIPLTADRHDIRITFAPISGGRADGSVDAEETDDVVEEPDDDLEETDEDGEPDEDDEAEEPAGVRLEYSATIDLEEHEVALVTVDPGGRTLVRAGAP
ncbi:MAG TPA: hypothetical protein VFQ21_10390 [Gemmatimonadota bacterium]|nr:hypothetical protein [Gemmatimonadota bacterium]